MRIYNSYRAIDKQCRSHASVILSKSPCQKMSSNDHPLDCSSFVSSGRLMCTIFDTTSYWELSITTLFVRLYTSIFTKLSHDFVHWHRTLSPGLFSYSPSHAFYPMKPKPVHSGPLARNYTTTPPHHTWMRYRFRSIQRKNQHFTPLLDQLEFGRFWHWRSKKRGEIIQLEDNYWEANYRKV